MYSDNNFIRVGIKFCWPGQVYLKNKTKSIYTILAAVIPIINQFRLYSTYNENGLF